MPSVLALTTEHVRSVLRYLCSSNSSEIRLKFASLRFSAADSSLWSRAMMPPLSPNIYRMRLYQSALIYNIIPVTGIELFIIFSFFGLLNIGELFHKKSLIPVSFLDPLANAFKQIVGRKTLFHYWIFQGSSAHAAVNIRHRLRSLNIQTNNTWHESSCKSIF